MIRLSYSKIDKFNRCKRQYQYHYLMNRIETEKSDQLIVGKAIHNALEKYREYLINNKKESDIDKAMEIVVKESNYPSQTVSETILEQGSRIMENVSVTEFNNTGVETLICLEKGKWTSPEKPPETCEFIGYVDFWYILPGGYSESGEIEKSTLFVEDDKTGYTNYSNSDITLDDEDQKENMQTFIYAVGLYDILSEKHDLSENVIINVYNLFMPSRSGNYKISISELKEKVNKFISENREKIESEKEFLPDLGKACDWCEYKKYCSEYMDGGSLVFDWQDADRRKKQAEQRLKEYLKENGNIQIGNQFFGYIEKDSYAWGGAEVVRYLADHIENINDWLANNFHMSKTDFTKIVNKYKLNADEYMPLAKVKKSKSMGFIGK